MSQIDDLPPLRDVIERHGLSALKSLGQNFLLDLNLTSRIARAAGNLAGRTVVEIGPGPGGLTRALLEWAEENPGQFFNLMMKASPPPQSNAKGGGLSLTLALHPALAPGPLDITPNTSTPLTIDHDG